MTSFINRSAKLCRAVVSLLMLASALSACEMVVDVDVPEHAPKLTFTYSLSNLPQGYLDTVAGSGTPEPRLGSALVSHSQGILSNEPLQLLLNATIRIFGSSGAQVDSLTNFNGAEGYYFSTTHFLAEPGERYRVEINVPGYPTATAAVQMPELVPLFDGSFTVNPAKSTTDETVGRLRVSFQDPAGRGNYYRVMARLLDEEGRVLPAGYVSLFEEDGQVGETQEEVRLGNAFEDANYAGRTITLSNTIRFPAQVIDFQGQFMTKAAFLDVRLYSLSEADFKYERTLSAYEDSNGNPFAEPTRVYSNMQQGYGVFGAQAVSRLRVRLP